MKEYLKKVNWLKVLGWVSTIGGAACGVICSYVDEKKRTEEINKTLTEAVQKALGNSPADK